MNPPIFITASNINMIKFRRHTIRLNLGTGELNVDRRKYPLHKAIEYKPYDECPETNRILLEAFSMCTEPKEVRRHFWESLGYLMLADQVILHNFILFGDPRSEKHTIMNALKPILNPQSVKNKLELKHLYPRNIHTDDEIEQNTVIPFHNFRRMDQAEHEEIGRLIREELPAVAAKAVNACQELAIRGGFRVPWDCEEARSDYMRNVDHVGTFLRQRMVILEGQKVKTSSLKITDAYRKWSGYSKARYFTPMLLRELKSRGARQVRNHLKLRSLEGLVFV